MFALDYLSIVTHDCQRIGLNFAVNFVPILA